jgi:hypothetical protein
MQIGDVVQKINRNLRTPNFVVKAVHKEVFETVEMPDIMFLKSEWVVMPKELKPEECGFKISLPGHDVLGAPGPMMKPLVDTFGVTSDKPNFAPNNITHLDTATFRAMIGFSYSCNAIDQYQAIATKSAIYPGQSTPLGLAYVALKLNGEAGEFAEHVGKAMRDDNYIKLTGTHINKTHGVDFNSLNADRHLKLLKEIGDILWYASAA